MFSVLKQIRIVNGVIQWFALLGFYLWSIVISMCSWNGMTFDLSDGWIPVLQCQQSCEERLSVVAGSPVPRMLAEIYHYLQFAYYKREFTDSSGGVMSLCHHLCSFFMRNCIPSTSGVFLDLVDCKIVAGLSRCLGPLLGSALQLVTLSLTCM